MVDLVGIEPTTSSMPWKRAPNCATGPQRGETSLFSLTGQKSSNETGAEPSIRTGSIQGNETIWVVSAYLEGKDGKLKITSFQVLKTNERPVDR